jgi:uncharacterized membrane protein
MAVDIVRTASCRAPLEVAFDYVADYRNIPSWMLGIEQFVPVGDQDRGEGAEFDVTARFGVRLHTRIRATEWVDHRIIGMESVRGVAVCSRFSFAKSIAGAASRTDITAEVSYRLPGGPAGRMMHRAVGPFVSRAVQHANHALVAGIERQAAAA